MSDYFKDHEEQAFILRSFIVILAILTTASLLPGLTAYLIFMAPTVLAFYILFKTITGEGSLCENIREHISFVPSTYYERESVLKNTTWVTYSLVIINIVVFFFIELPLLASDPEFITDNLIFFPNKPNSWNIAASVFTSMFLHANILHLLGNMSFLWAVGAVVERRTGWGKFLLFYLATGIVANIVYAATSIIFTGSPPHGLGASGAIAGIMGIFAVRCYFKDMSFPIPILGILPLNINIKMNSIVLIGLFFIVDLIGGVKQIKGNTSDNIAHWVHLAGMITGIGLAYYKDMHKQAVEERYHETGMKVYDRGYGFSEGEKAFKATLDLNPDNAEALLNLARIKSNEFTGYTKEARDLYQKAIKLLATADPKEATAVYKEYKSKYSDLLEPDVIYRLAHIYRNAYDLDMASRCLEILATSDKIPSGIKEKALFQLGPLLEQMGMPEAAIRYYAAFIEAYPGSPSAAKINKKLTELKGNNPGAP